MYLSVPLVTWLEWVGSGLGLLGAFLLATNTRYSRHGWWVFLAANFVMISWGAAIHANGFILQQIGFTVTSLLGLYRNGFFAWAFNDKKLAKSS